MRRMVLLLAGLGTVVCLGATTASGAGPAGCAASSLRGAFAEVPGSGAAGHISYRLRLTNHGRHTCAVSGRPGLRLLGRRGRSLPTHVVADRPGRRTAPLVRVRPGHSALATATFSPDVPGSGEPARGSCEPKAFSVRVTLRSPAHGRLVVSVRPATPVCEHGRIVLGTLRG